MLLSRRRRPAYHGKERKIGKRVIACKAVRTEFHPSGTGMRQCPIHLNTATATRIAGREWRRFPGRQDIQHRIIGTRAGGKPTFSVFFYENKYKFQINRNVHEEKCV